MTNWITNDELFKRELATGHVWAAKLADALRTEGLTVELTPMNIRDNVEQRGDFANEGDLVVHTGQGPILLESKSRGLRFTTIENYPYKTALVDTVSGWNQKTDKPKAIVLTSQLTEARLVISVSRTERFWVRKYHHDKKRDIWDCFYEVPKARLVPFQDLIGWLKWLGAPSEAPAKSPDPA